jgi:hypothetical protein
MCNQDIKNKVAFAISVRPFCDKAELAKRTGTSEVEVGEALESLKDESPYFARRIEAIRCLA